MILAVSKMLGSSSDAFKKHWIFLLILFFACMLDFHGFNGPCEQNRFYHLIWGCDYLTNISQNYASHGFIETKFGPVIDISASGALIYDIHHPSEVFYVLVGSSYRLFGPSPWSLRLVPALFWIADIVFIYALGRRYLKSTLAANIAVFIFTVVPMGSVYGIHIDDQGAVSLFFIILVIWLYNRWVDTGFSRSSLIALYVAFAVGTQSDWPIYLLVPIIFAAQYIYFKKIPKELLFLAIIALACLSLEFLYIRYLTGSFVGINGAGNGSLIDGLVLRAGKDMKIDGSEPSLLNVISWSRKVLGTYIPQFYTPAALTIFGLWLIATIKDFFSRRKISRDLLIIGAFLALGTIYALIFVEGSYVHSYWTLYLLPGIALACGSFLARLKSRIGAGISGFVIVFSLIIIAYQSAAFLWKNDFF